MLIHIPDDSINKLDNNNKKVNTVNIHYKSSDSSDIGCNSLNLNKGELIKV